VKQPKAIGGNKSYGFGGVFPGLLLNRQRKVYRDDKDKCFAQFIHPNMVKKHGMANMVKYLAKNASQLKTGHEDLKFTIPAVNVVTPQKRLPDQSSISAVAASSSTSRKNYNRNDYTPQHIPAVNNLAESTYLDYRDVNTAYDDSYTAYHDSYMLTANDSYNENENEVEQNNNTLNASQSSSQSLSDNPTQVCLVWKQKQTDGSLREHCLELRQTAHELCKSLTAFENNSYQPVVTNLTHIKIDFDFDSMLKKYVDLCLIASEIEHLVFPPTNVKKLYTIIGEL